MPWYTEYFDEDYLCGRRGHVGIEQTTNEADFILAHTDIKPGHRVLDVCCGQGRHCLEMGRRGVHMVGLDLSPYLLELAARSADESRTPYPLVRADMRRVPFEGCFDAAINMFTAFGYLEDDDQDQQVLHAVRRALKPGGSFLMDTLNREWIIRHFRPTMWFDDPSGTLMLAETRLDLSMSRITSREILIDDEGRKREREHTIRLYTCTEIMDMIQEAELEVEGVWGGFDAGPYELDSRRMIILSRRL